MTLHFGLKLDAQVYSDNLQGLVAGPVKMLELLSDWLALRENFRDNEYIRIESYRRAIESFLETQEETFFSQSFQADSFSTAAKMLIHRDELLLSGFDMTQTAISQPERVAVFLGIEVFLKKQLDFPRGECEIITDLTALLPSFQLPFSHLVLYDRIEHFPPHWQKIIQILQQKNGVILTIADTAFPQPPASFNAGLSDLQVLQRMLATNHTDYQEPSGDGSLLIVKAGRETDLAEWFSKMLKDNPSFRPVCFMPEPSRLLDTAFMMEGVPAMGIASASSARAVLQLLKLVTVFLWQPIDPYRILEFLSLPVKPLDERLARLLSQVMSEKPGLYSSLWAAKVREFWEKSAERYGKEREGELKKIKSQYEFWFDRRRYEQNKKVPKAAVINIFEYLKDWSSETYGKNKSSSLLVLASQAEKIADLLHTIPQKELSYLELERIIRVVYASSPLMLEQREMGSLDFCHHGGAIISPVNSMAWWNFSEQLDSPPADFWTDEERSYLSQSGCILPNRSSWNNTQIEHRNRPVFAVKERLLLLVSENVRGTQTLEHSLMGYIRAAFKNYKKLEVNLDEAESVGCDIGNFFNLQKKVPVQQIEKCAAEPFINIPDLSRLKKIRDFETPTSIQDLVYYPYKWAFSYKARLQPGAILSVAKDNRLMGNLAHSVFETMLLEDFSSWDKSYVGNWIDKKVPEVLFKEGATFLMYGREQERSRFISRLNYAAWTLISQIKSNGWNVVATECDRNGTFNDIDIKAKLDLILERGNEKAIVDLKWSGYSTRSAQLKNLEDLQLVLYAELIKGEQLPHTAYFIIDQGKMLARNKDAFKEAETVVTAGGTASEIHDIIINRLRKTYDWRWSQLEAGIVEMRTEKNVSDIEKYYADEQVNLMEMLEMKSKSAPWDNYKVLINGIR